MTTLRGAALVARLEADLNCFPFPSYLIDVTDNEFELRAISQSAKDVLAIDGTDLPARMMESLGMALRSCARAGESQDFTQLYAANTSDLWLRTSLMPISDRNGDVIFIFAQMVDVTEQTDRAIRLTRRSATQRVTLDRSRIATHDTAADICQALDGNDIDRARRLADDLRTTARSPLDRRFEVEEVDFARTCADLCSVLDPHDKFRIAYDDGILLTDPVFLHVALRSCLIEAISRAEKYVSIDLFETPTGNTIMVTDDGPRVLHPQLPDLESFLNDRGGALSFEPSQGITGNRASIFLPDQLAEPAQVRFGSVG